jgi:thymidine phosphorylase
MALAAEMLILGGLAGDADAARVALQRALDSGGAAERFARMVRALGGPTDLIERPWEHLERAPVTVEVWAAEAGIVQAIDTRSVGLAVVVLGGGRTRPQDDIDHAVGLTDLTAVGDHLGSDGVGRPLAVVHARTADAAAGAASMLRSAYTVGGTAPMLPAVVRERVVLR